MLIRECFLGFQGQSIDLANAFLRKIFQKGERFLLKLQGILKSAEGNLM